MQNAKCKRQNSLPWKGEVDARRADGGVQRAQKQNALSDPSEKYLQNFSSPPFRGGVGAFRCGIFVKIINRLQRNYAFCILHSAIFSPLQAPFHIMWWGGNYVWAFLWRNIPFLYYLRNAFSYKFNFCKAYIIKWKRRIFRCFKGRRKRRGPLQENYLCFFRG